MKTVRKSTACPDVTNGAKAVTLLIAVRGGARLLTGRERLIIMVTESNTTRGVTVGNIQRTRLAGVRDSPYPRGESS
jgi:hypothetical protein